MKISPIDIRQHTFEKGFRGYDIDEVDAFMNSLSQEWERVSSENKALKARLEAAENDLARMKDIEKTLYLTLKTAEETSKKITAQATQEAEIKLQEAASKSDALMNDAVQKANQLLKEAEKKANLVQETIGIELANQEKDLQALEKHRTELLQQLKTLVQTTTGIIEGFDQKFTEDLSSTKLHTLREEVIDAPVVSVDPYAYEPVVAAVVKEEENILVEEESDTQEETFEVNSKVLSDDELLEEMIAEEESSLEITTMPSEDPVASEEATSEIDAADRALAEIEQIRASRREEEPEAAPVVVPVEKEENRKYTGSFFDQIG